MSDLADLTEQIRAFSEERDWTQFHDPKSLALALVGEVGELAELLQWLPASEAAEQIAHEPLRQRMAEEMSDILIYLLRLADVAGIDLGGAATAKLMGSRGPFPHCGGSRGPPTENVTVHEPALDIAGVCLSGL